MNSNENLKLSTDYNSMSTAELYAIGYDYESDDWNSQINAEFIERANPYYLYLAGRHWSSLKYTEDIKEALLEWGNAKWFYLAGKNWPIDRFSKSLVDALINANSAEWLSNAGLDWSPDRYTPEIGYALAHTNDTKWIEYALNNWPKSRKRDIKDSTGVKQAEEESPYSDWSAYKLYAFGRDCSDDEWDNRVTDELIKRRDSEFLHWAGFMWPNDRYDPGIRQALIDIGDAWALYAAGVTWEYPWYDKTIMTALIDSGDAEWLYEAGRDWRDDRYSPLIGYALYNTHDEKCISKANEIWPIDRRNDINHNPADLLMADKDRDESIPRNASDEFVKLAEEDEDVIDYWALFEFGRDCPDDEWNDDVRNELIQQMDAQGLHWAGYRWNDDRYDHDIRRALIEAGDPAYLYEAGCKWNDERYSPEIGYALDAANSPFWRAQAMQDWSIARKKDLRSRPVDSFDIGINLDENIPRNASDESIKLAEEENPYSEWSAHQLYYFGYECLTDAWDDRIRDELIKRGNAFYLYLAGKDWNDDRYSPEIGYELFSIGDSSEVNQAVLAWPDHRIEDLKSKPADSLAMSNMPSEDIPRNASDESVKLAEEDNPYSDWSDRNLFNYGRIYSDDEWDDRIRDELIERGIAFYLYKAGCEWDNERFNDDIRDALIATGDAQWLYGAGFYWDDGVYNDDIKHALIKTRNAKWLYNAGLNWKHERYSPEIGYALYATNVLFYIHYAEDTWPENRKKDVTFKPVDSLDIDTNLDENIPRNASDESIKLAEEDNPYSDWSAYQLYNSGYECLTDAWDERIRDELIKRGDALYLYLAGRDWILPNRYNDSIRDALIETGDAESLYRACYSWYDDRYSHAIRDALIKTGNSERLYMAGLKWKPERYSPEIGYALFNTRNSLWIRQAKEDWPESRKKDITSNPVDYIDINTNLDENIPRNASDEFAKLAEEDNPYSDWSAYTLLNFGIDCSDDKWDDNVRDELIKRGDAYYLCMSGRFWNDERFNNDVRNAFIDLGDAKCLHLAGRLWNEERYGNDIRQALIDTGDAEWLYEAGKLWFDHRYSPEIGYALHATGNDEYINKAKGDWPENRKKDVTFNPADSLNLSNIPGESIPKFSTSNEFNKEENPYSDWDAYQLYNFGKNCSKYDWDDRIRDELIKRGNAEYLYLAGIDWKNGRYDHSIRDAFIATGSLGLIQWSGRDWRNSRFGPSIRNALIDAQKPEYLYAAGFWKPGRYSPEIGHALYATGHKEYISHAMQKWPEDRKKDVTFKPVDSLDIGTNLDENIPRNASDESIDPVKLAGENKTEEEYYKQFIEMGYYRTFKLINEEPGAEWYTVAVFACVDLAVNNLPRRITHFVEDIPQHLYNNRIKRKIVDGIIASGDDFLLYQAGREWPNYAYSPEIGYALFNTGNSLWIRQAKEDWPEKRRKDITFKPVDSLDIGTNLDENIPRNASDESTEAEESNPYSDWTAEQLYYFGKDCSDDEWDDRARTELAKRDDALWLFGAGRDWKDRRYNDSIHDALVATGDSWMLYSAGKEWNNDRYSPEIGYALVNTGITEWIDRAERKWLEYRKKDLDISPADSLTDSLNLDESIPTNASVNPVKLAEEDNPYSNWSIQQLFEFGRDCNAREWDDRIRDELIRRGDANYLYMAGCEWSNFRYRNSIGDALIKTGSVPYLFHVGLLWKDNRYFPKFGYALYASGSESYINQAMVYWPEDRQKDIRSKPADSLTDSTNLNESIPTNASIDMAKLAEESNPYSDWTAEYLCKFGRYCSKDEWDSRIRDELIKRKDSDCLFCAGLYWKGTRWDDSIREALIAIGNPEHLYEAGKFWDKDYYSPEIGYALFAIGDKEWIGYAKTGWPRDRVGDLTFNPANSFDANMNLDETIPTNASDESTEAIDEDNPFSNWDAEKLYEFGKDCSKDAWDDRIRDELIKRGIAGYLYQAGEHWDNYKYDDSIRDALIKSGNAMWLHQAGVKWRNERYSSSILDALIRTGNADWLFQAGKDWNDERYSPEIGYALHAAGEEDISNEWPVHKSQNFWPKDRRKDVRFRPPDSLDPTNLRVVNESPLL